MIHAEARRAEGAAWHPSSVMGVALGGALFYLASAAVAVVIAYDPFIAWLRLVTILLGFAACMLLGWAGHQGWAGAWIVLGAISSLIGLWLGAVARFASAHDSAAIAEALGLGLPLQAAGMLWAYRQGRRWTAGLLGIGLLLNLWWLVLAGERSVWPALGVGTISAWAYASTNRRWRWVNTGWMIVLLGLGALYMPALVWPSMLSRLPFAADSALAERAALWQQMLFLAGDYRFTGMGLGMTPMVASSYQFLLHVPLYYHAHNTFLQVLLEQGVLGLIGFSALALAALALLYAPGIRKDERLRPPAACGLAALMTLITHSLLDAELYVSALVPLYFLPFGFVWSLYSYAYQAEPEMEIEAEMEDILRSADHLRLVWMTGGLALAVAALWIGLGGRSSWYANLGALAQTQIELSRYHWPETPLQDQIRLRPDSALNAALEKYQAALQINPRNVTAHRRLGQIALSQGDLSLTHQQLGAAYALHPRDRAIRQMLGESLALAGEAVQAADLWQTIDVSQGQLEIRLAWYQHFGDLDSFQLLREAIDLYERKLALP